MEKVEATDPEAHSPDLVAENIAMLRELFPDLITEGPAGVSVNVDVLRSLVGDRALTDCDEKYGLNWHGKRQARQLALTPSTGTLRPCPDESVDWDTTRNIFIEGDNLEVLKLLQKSYAGKVKLIYIDPPYNTGKDFVYPDDYRDNIRNYLELTGQVDGAGRRITSNTDASGRFHTSWLNMMYPRLKLARNLLREDGLVMVSIDDAELASLKTIMADVFGEENFVATFTWETKRAARGVPPTTLLMANHEYVHCFAKSAAQIRFRGLDRSEADFANPDNDPRGLWRSESMKATGSQDNYFAITDPRTGNRFDGNWAFAEATIHRMVDDDLILFPANPGGVPRQKKFIDSYLNDTKASVTALGWHSTETSTKQVMDLFEGQKIFDFPKPLSLIERLLRQATGAYDLVLDFFAGSGTTGHAVMHVNAADGGNRRYVLVQLPEPLNEESKVQKAAAEYCDSLGRSRNIAEITKERLRRAGQQIRRQVVEGAGKAEIGSPAKPGRKSKAVQSEPPPLDLFATATDAPAAQADVCFALFEPSRAAGVDTASREAPGEPASALPDLGFRVFKLASSNIREWDPAAGAIAQTLEESIDHLKHDRTEMDILYELLLKLGLDLCVPIQKKSIPREDAKRQADFSFGSFAASREASPGSLDIYSVGGGVLMACLSTRISRADAEPLGLAMVEWRKALAPAGDTTCIFRDSAFVDDVAKTNLAAILEQNGIARVRSL